VAHLRLYLMLAYQSRVKNNIKLLTPAKACQWFGAAETKRWADVMRDNITPAIGAVEQIAGINIGIDIQRANTRGKPVVGVRPTAGAQSRFKDSAHRKRYEIRMSRRNVSAETERLFVRDLDVILGNFNPDVDSLDRIKAGVKKRILADFYAECRSNGKPQRDGQHIVSPLLDEAYVRKQLVDSIREHNESYRDWMDEEARISRHNYHAMIDAERWRLFPSAMAPEHDVDHIRIDDTRHFVCGREVLTPYFTTPAKVAAGRKITCPRCRTLFEAMKFESDADATGEE
jgi:hypothetical protein